MYSISAQNVRTFVLTELEWYAATEQQQEAWIAQCKREAEEAKCTYACILVEPDAVMSISPIAKRHKVWGHSSEAETPAWAHIMDLFKKHGMPPPPVRLRDELAFYYMAYRDQGK